MSIQPKIGIALGSGAARGAAHIGVLKGLHDLGIKPDIICGTSIGAMVAGAYVSNRLEQVERWLLTLKWRELIKVFDFHFKKGGLIRGERAIQVLEELDMNMNIEDSPIPLGIVSTDMHSGREIWLKKGNMLTAIKASCAIPGIVAPVKINHNWLYDGAIVNPVPVSLCKALGAEVIIAVNLTSSTTVSRLHAKQSKKKPKKLPFVHPINQYISKLIHPKQEEQPSYAPQYFDVVNSMFDIMQEQITKSRMAGEPPDISLNPRLTDFGMFQFDRSKEALEEGYQCVMRSKDALLSLIQLGHEHFAVEPSYEMDEVT